MYSIDKRPHYQIRQFVQSGQIAKKLCGVLRLRMTQSISVQRKATSTRLALEHELTALVDLLMLPQVSLMAEERRTRIAFNCIWGQRTTMNESIVQTQRPLVL